MIWSPPPKTMMSKSSNSVSQHITHCSPAHNSCSSSHHHIFATIILFGWLLNIHSLRLSTLNICCILSRVVLLLWVMSWRRGRVVLSRWLLWVASWKLLLVSCWCLNGVHPWGLCWVVRLRYRGRLRVRCITLGWWTWWIRWWLSIWCLRLWRSLRIWWRRTSCGSRFQMHNGQSIFRLLTQLFTCTY